MLSAHECQQARLSRDPRFDGLFFILVHTTKIFCRNTCRVRMPLEKNVSYAPSAQQALDSGFRPCLRCRPDSAPHSYAWQGTNTTVNRAMKLLSARDGGNIEKVSSRLGLSSRYLHKLFTKHLQMSPKRYRLYQQVLMAKNLLQQTPLSVEDVASSVGFPSARQLQHHVKTLLQLTPTQIRANAISKATSAKIRSTKLGFNKPPLNKGYLLAMNQNVEIFLSYRPPYNWQQVRMFFDRRCIIGNEHVGENEISKTLLINEVEVRVNIVHIAEKFGFNLCFNAIHSEFTLEIISIMRRMFDLDASPNIISKALKAAGLSDEQCVEGLRVPGVASPFEAVCRAILGQQVSVSAAVTKVNQLFSRFAQHEQSAFPSAKMLASSDLTFLKMPVKRRQTLIDVASYFASLEDKNYSAENLLAIKGIGPWTLSYVDMRATGNSNIWLDTDLIIKQQVAKFIEQGRPLKAELAAPWRSYLTLNLWSMA